MPFIKKILWATDFSDEATEALYYAKMFADVFQADLLAVHVVPDFSPALYNTAMSVKGELIRRVDEIKQEAEDKLNEIQEKNNLSFASIIKEGSASKKIIETAEEENADLIVIGKHGMSAIETFFIGSITTRVLHNSPVPMLITKKKSPQHKIDKILVPTDFSEHEEVEQDYAFSLAEGLEAELTLLNVMELHNYQFSEDTLEEMMTALQEKLRNRKERKDKVKVSEYVTRAIDAADGIVDYAQDNHFDLVVISTCGPGPVERFFLGSTTEKVISRSQSPVFAIPSRFCKK
jgi:nucleotide-binding universal stress UspA family protein